jgi:hypothetical protein
MIFDFSFSKKVRHLPLSSTKIGVEGSIFENDRPFTLGEGTWVAGEGPI